MEIPPQDFTDYFAERGMPADPVTTRLINRDTDSLNAAWTLSYAQELISQATGALLSLDPLEKGWSTRERDGTPHRLIVTLSDTLIALGRTSYLPDSIDSCSAQEIAYGLLGWISYNLHYVFTSATRGSREKEYSMYHRMTCLVYQSLMIHRALTQMGACDDAETYRLALIISLKSKQAIRNPYERLTDYALILAAFDIIKLDPSDYLEIFRDEAVISFENRLQSIREQVLIRRVYLQMPQDAFEFLAAVIIKDTKMTYDDFFRAYFGYNAEEERISFSEMSRRTGLNSNAFQVRLAPTVRYIYDVCMAQVDDQSGPSLSLSVLLGNPLTREATPLTECTFAEIETYRNIQLAEEKLAELRELAEDNNWRRVFAHRSELLFYTRVVGNYIALMRADMQRGKHSETKRYKAVSAMEYSHLEGLAALTYPGFPVGLISIRFPFLKKDISHSTCAKVLNALFARTQSSILSETRLGLLHKERLIAAEMLQSPQQAASRWQEIRDLFWQDPRARVSTARREKKQDVAKVLEYTPTTLSNISAFFIIEAIASGITKQTDRSRLASILNTTAEELEALQVRQQDSRYYEKIRDTVVLVLRELFMERRHLHEDEDADADMPRYAQLGLLRNSSIALNIALHSLDHSCPYMATRFLLLFRIQGYSGRQVAFMISEQMKAQSIHSIICTTFTETAKVLFQRKPSKK